MESLITACGMDCTRCRDFKQKCAGCEAIEGRVFWAHDFGAEICPLYDCARNEKGFVGCGICPQLPCVKFFDLRDPAVPIEKHQKDIERRVKRLKPIL